jgi:hypothetical protein
MLPRFRLAGHSCVDVVVVAGLRLVATIVARGREWRERGHKCGRSAWWARAAWHEKKNRALRLFSSSPATARRGEGFEEVSSFVRSNIAV